jgi:hypothetical protein
MHSKMRGFDAEPTYPNGSKECFKVQQGDLLFREVPWEHDSHHILVPKSNPMSARVFSALNGIPSNHRLVMVGYADTHVDADPKNRESTGTALAPVIVSGKRQVPVGPESVAASDLLEWALPVPVRLSDGSIVSSVQVEGAPPDKFQGYVRPYSMGLGRIGFTQMVDRLLSDDNFQTDSDTFAKQLKAVTALTVSFLDPAINDTGDGEFLKLYREIALSPNTDDETAAQKLQAHMKRLNDGRTANEAERELVLSKMRTFLLAAIFDTRQRHKQSHIIGTALGSGSCEYIDAMLNITGVEKH